MIRIVLGIQAVYYVVTGLWPIVSITTFEQVTGPKTDDWLVHMVGLLAVTIGVALAVGVFRPSPSRETITLAVCSILAIAAEDVVYVSQGTISRVYLVDAAVQILLLVSIVLATAWGRRQKADTFN